MNTFERSEEFDAWLAGLKDKVGAHGSPIAFGLQSTVISVAANRWAREFSKCASTSGPAIVPILRGVQKWSICFFWAATSPRKSVTLNAPLRWREFLERSDL